MKVHTKTFELQTRGYTDIQDITPQVRDIVHQVGVKEGMVHVFVPGSTAAITTIEYEAGLLKDLPEVLEKIVPMKQRYHHDGVWGEGNGYAHLRAALIGASLTVPLSGGQLILGTWQQIVLLDFDNRPRRRSIVVQVMGE